MYLYRCIYLTKYEVEDKKVKCTKRKIKVIPLTFFRVIFLRMTKIEDSHNFHHDFFVVPPLLSHPNFYYFQFISRRCVKNHQTTHTHTQ